MSPKERVLENKFSHNNLKIELYELMERCMGYDPVLDPPASILDSSNGIQTYGRRNPSSAPTENAANSPQPTSFTDAGEETSPIERKLTNSVVPKKARKRTHQLDVGLREAT
ncbi:hypothetical protein GOP47_0012720 [Adiantum capillus-veneris]|uniref:Uncharacterized protein n=1 Tax=Adiantum capillus-veneris TaxID=13818 RepID=A0A9D4URN0_ADICA|nr:hypothetical protein GOP47_0012720 [Adiantum capillus-veneris]